MCDLNGPFRLCTYSADIDYTLVIDYIWIVIQQKNNIISKQIKTYKEKWSYCEKIKNSYDFKKNKLWYTQ